MTSLTDKATKNMRKKSFEMLNVIEEKTRSESTHKKILDILEGETKLGREQRYQAVLKITDILNNSKNEEEITQKLNEEYPIA
jgi:hypothetical protein